jgi:hypothetical protein
MQPDFRYPDKDWSAIIACLAKLGACSTSAADAHLHDFYRHTLEAIVHSFRWMTERTDPRSPEVAKAKALWTKTSRDLRAVLDDFAQLETMKTQPIRVLGYAIAAKPETAVDWASGEPLEPQADYTPHADYLALKAQIVVAEKCATIAARGWPKSLRWKRDATGQPSRPLTTVAGPNRSRGDNVDKLFGDLFTFWVDRGGHVGQGKDTESPSTRFVMAAAGRILSKTVPDVKLPRAINDFARSRQFNKASRIWTSKT